MHKNSSANSTPAATPGQKVPSRKEKWPRRQHIKPQTSSAASAERTPICITGLMLGAATLTATCCKPQQMHNNIITLTAKPSNDLRALLMLAALSEQRRLAVLHPCRDLG